MRRGAELSGEGCKGQDCRVTLGEKQVTLKKWRDAAVLDELKLRSISIDKANYGSATPKQKQVALSRQCLRLGRGSSAHLRLSAEAEC